jgi:formylglycine-generating enzyme required for sulfatase activity
MAEGRAAQNFYRVAGSTGSVITALSSAGILTWSNASLQGSYTLEHTGNISGRSWAPLTRGTFSNQVSSVRVYDRSAPEGMVFIPGGRFMIGDSQGDQFVFPVANPVHPVEVSPFFMDRYEFTNERMRQVLQWAWEKRRVSVSANVVLAEGPTTILVGLGKLDSEISFTNGVFTVRTGREGYPAQYVSWFGAVACCNFLSEMSGREICYQFSTWSCDMAKSGFRLPTEAEWEFAARGGYEGLRFPWPATNVITHSDANYLSDTNNWYDVSPTRGFHPDYANLHPRSSPVGSFAPNPYGLYDMAGDSWEWTWDWYGRYPPGLQINPTGPGSGTLRVFRGGSWFTKAERLTCAVRYPANPATVFNDISFRTILPLKR